MEDISTRDWMFLWLIDHLFPLYQQLETHTSGDSRIYLTARIALASVTSFLLAIATGPAAIAWLKQHFRERVKSASATLDKLHESKNETPTMGGLFIVASIVISVLLWGNLQSLYVIIALLICSSFALLGAADDWIKLSTRHHGLNVWTKFVIQWTLALFASYSLYRYQSQIPGGLKLYLPFVGGGIDLDIWFILWSAFVMVSLSNGVNLTDGLDGLAGGCVVFSGAAFVALTYLAGHVLLADYLEIPYLAGAGEVSVVVGAMVGAMLGFLWFNCYPAQVFMGDTGSLPIGALLAYAALVTRQEFLLVIVGGVFVLETLSVIFQVGWFRLTGQRLIACSPLHNHYVFQGQHEHKIVVRFWIGSALLAILGVASLKIG